MSLEIRSGVNENLFCCIKLSKFLWSNIMPACLALYLLIYLFTVQVKELSAQVRRYTQGIWSYINPKSNEAEMAAYLLPPSSFLLALPGVIPLIKVGLVLSVCVCVCVCSLWVRLQGPGCGTGESKGDKGIRGRLVVFKNYVWSGKPGEALWGHPLPLYKLRAVPAGAREELNERAYWPVTPAQPLCRSPYNPGEGTADLSGSHSFFSFSKAAGDSWVSQHPSCANLI